jgi:hypothetical protein
MGIEQEANGRAFRPPCSHVSPTLLLHYSYLVGRVFIKIFPLLVLFVFNSGCAKMEARLLRYAFSTEGVQRYRTTLTMSSSNGAGTKILLEETHRVQEVSPDGNAWVEVRFDTAEVHLSDPQSLAAAFLARSLQGKVLRIKVSASGEVGSVDDSGAQGSPGGIDLAQTFSQVFPPLPATSIRPGDSWTAERTVPVPSPRMDITNHVLAKYILKGFEHREGKELARVQVKTMATLRGATQAPGGKKLEGKMTGEGEFLFALEEGRLLSLEMRNKTEITSQNEKGHAQITATDQVVKVEALQ